MKKFYILCIFISALFSCNNDDTSSPAEPNPNLLQRVDMYPGTDYEKRWLFNSDGLLEKITKADGTLVQDFIYNGNDRLASSTIYSDSGDITYTFSYDSNGYVTAVNSQNLQYDVPSATYYFGDLNASFTKFRINNDRLLLMSETGYMDEVEPGEFQETIWSSIDISYTNNNISAYYPDDHCNYLTYDDKVNPLKYGTLAIGRAFSFAGGSGWPYDHSISANNVLTHEYCPEDPESSVYHYTYNANNLPTEQTQDSYYLGALEGTRVSAKYYYQGEVLP